MPAFRPEAHGRKVFARRTRRERSEDVAPEPLPVGTHSRLPLVVIKGLPLARVEVSGGLSEFPVFCGADARDDGVEPVQQPLRRDRVLARPPYAVNDADGVVFERYLGIAIHVHVLIGAYVQPSARKVGDRIPPHEFHGGGRRHAAHVPAVYEDPARQPAQRAARTKTKARGERGQNHRYRNRPEKTLHSASSAAKSSSEGENPGVPTERVPSA